MSDNYGKLITPPLELQRRNFEECCKLLGVCVKYQWPLSENYTNQAEADFRYSLPEDVWCIFSEHLDQKTQRKLGWNAELQEEMSVISLPYNLHDLQINCLVEVPSAFDDTPGRKFRIAEMSTIMIYPASITCRLVPEYKTTMPKSETELFVNNDFNLLYSDDEVTSNAINYK